MNRQVRQNQILSLQGRNRTLDAYFPTQHLPGSPEKIALMAARVKLKLSCFHRDDVRVETRDADSLAPCSARNGQTACATEVSSTAADAA